MTPANRWIWLKNAKRATVQKGQLSTDKLAQISEGAELRLGHFRVKITKTLVQATEVLQEVSNDDKKDVEAAVETTKVVVDTQKPLQQAPPRLDTDLLRRMRPHQASGAAFLLARLLGENVKWSDPELPVVSSDAGTAEGAAVNTLPVTGAILADDMGMGKTLTALAVIWALVRHGRCKGVVVCPSGLIQNWKAEIQKWVPALAAKTIFVSPAKKLQQVGEFVQSKADIAPLLVVSYEVFRSMAAQLNTATTWEVLVCDEGHRLKNVKHTCTSLALGTCTAVRRLVLTGTPIQNNLDELYSVIDFTCPGYFGDLQTFQERFAKPLTVQKRPKSAKKSTREKCDDVDEYGDCSDSEVNTAVAMQLASSTLQSLLSRILVRRNRSSTLTSVLPPKSVYTVYCKLSAQQTREYLALCDQCLGNIRKNSDGYEAQLVSDMDKCSALPLMTELRLLSVSAFPTAQSTGSSTDSQSSTQILEELFKRSSKMSILDSLLCHLQLSAKVSGTDPRVHPPQEKVVVVSNFSDILDDVAVLAKQRHWAALRIDGQTTADKRTRCVVHFNNPSSPFFVLLLSAKAGGVGLNLIGGSRLVMLDPDWNPATDAQAMARVWRDGQTKPVHIYRLFSVGTIEESILQRQREKKILEEAVHSETASNLACPARPGNLNAETKSGIRHDITALTNAEVERDNTVDSNEADVHPRQNNQYKKRKSNNGESISIESEVHEGSSAATVASSGNNNNAELVLKCSNVEEVVLPRGRVVHSSPMEDKTLPIDDNLVEYASEVERLCSYAGVAHVIKG